MNKSLILVDIQNDFIDGSLAVPDGKSVVAVANRFIQEGDYLVVAATQDWHPADHGSFASNSGVPQFSVFELNGLSQVAWPDHCIQNTHGSEFHQDLQLPKGHLVVKKGYDPEVDSYSGFYDNGRRNKTILDSYLKSLNVDEVDIIGLATDYCVGYTALDAANLGFKTTVYLEGCRGITPDGVQAMINKLRASGVTVWDADSP